MFQIGQDLTVVDFLRCQFQPFDASDAHLVQGAEFQAGRAVIVAVSREFIGQGCRQAYRRGIVDKDIGKYG